jgi:hypothetical protein
MKNLKRKFVVIGICFLSSTLFVYASGANDFFVKSTKKEINEKIRTFCSSGAYIEERCEKYCIELRDWFYWNDKWHKFWHPWELEGGWFYDAGATALCDAPNSSLNKMQVTTLPKVVVPKIQKKIIKNDDGTITEIVKKKINGQNAEIHTKFNEKKQKISESILTQTKNKEGEVVKNSATSYFGDEQEFRKKVIDDTYKDDVLIQSIEIKEGNQKTIQVTSKYQDGKINRKETLTTFKNQEKSINSNEEIEMQILQFNNNGSIIEKIVKNKNVEDSDFGVVKHVIYNSGLKKYEDKLQNGEILQFLIDDEKIEEARVYYDKINQEILIYEENILESEFVDTKDYERFKIKVLGDKFLISSFDVEASVESSLIIENKSGSIFINTGIENEDMIEIKVLPNVIAEKAKRQLSKVENIEIVDKEGFKYKVFGKVDKKILKFFTMTLDSASYYDLSSGDLINQETQTIFEKIKSVIGFN